MFSLAGVAAGLQFRPHYFLQALPALASLAGVALGAAAAPLLAAAPARRGAIGLAALIFGVILALTRYVSLGSILGALSLPLTLLALHVGLDVRSAPPVWIFAIVVPAFILWTHRANVRRLLNGTESKVGRSG